MKIRFRYYERFSSVDPALRALVLRRCGISSGVMRREAKRLDASVVIATWGDLPLGWIAALAPFGRRKIPELQIFVSKAHRRLRIGSRLLAKLFRHQPEIENKARVWIDDERATGFWQSRGFEPVRKKALQTRKR